MNKCVETLNQGNPKVILLDIVPKLGKRRIPNPNELKRRIPNPKLGKRRIRNLNLSKNLKSFLFIQVHIHPDNLTADMQG